MLKLYPNAAQDTRKYLQTYMRIRFPRIVVEDLGAMCTLLLPEIPDGAAEHAKVMLLALLSCYHLKMLGIGYEIETKSSCANIDFSIYQGAKKNAGDQWHESCRLHCQIQYSNKHKSQVSESPPQKYAITGIDVGRRASEAS